MCLAIPLLTLPPMCRHPTDDPVAADQRGPRGRALRDEERRPEAHRLQDGVDIASAHGAKPLAARQLEGADACKREQRGEPDLRRVGEPEALAVDEHGERGATITVTAPRKATVAAGVSTSASDCVT